MKPGEALAQFVDELGATLSVNIQPLDTYSPTRRFLAQTIANDLDTWDVGTPIVPYEFPTIRGERTAARVAICWDRPTPATAGHRTFLRRALAGLGLPPEHCANIWAFPYALTDPPLENQILAFRDATLEAIAASGARYVVMLGGVVTKLWRRELQVGQLMGKMGVLESKWYCYVMPNPIVPLTDQLLMAGYRENLRTLVDIVHQDSGDVEFAALCTEKGCVDDYATSSGAFVYDPDGLPWCKDHWRKAFKRRADHRSRSAVIENGNNQGRLL